MCQSSSRCNNPSCCRAFDWLCAPGTTAVKTEKAYVHRVRRFIFCHGVRHPKDMGAAEVTSFLSHLAQDRNDAPSTQNQVRSPADNLTQTP